MISMQSDISKFRASLRAVVAQKRHPEAYIVNKALKDVAFRAASFTPKTTAGKIRAELPAKLIGRIASKRLRATKGKFTKEDLRAEVQKIRKRRRSGIGGLRAGWIPAIQALGGSYRGAKAKSGGSAAHGLAIKASGSRRSGLIRNTIVTTKFSTMTKTGAGNIAESINGLNRAIRFVTYDRELYVERKRAIGSVLAKHSDH